MKIHRISGKHGHTICVGALWPNVKFFRLLGSFQWLTLSKNVTWDQALFSFRFENYIPAGKAKISAVAVIENVWEPLKLGLISGYKERDFVSGAL